MKIYDCFIFFNELDLLEIRLNELYSVVDHFVLVESRFSFSNKPKPLFYAENKERFAKFQDKIIHIIIDKFEDDTSIPRADKLHHNWTREEEQRRKMFLGLSQANPEDIICVSDVDEIINHKVLEQIKESGIPEDSFISLILLFYKAKLNCLQTIKHQNFTKELTDKFAQILSPRVSQPTQLWRSPILCTVSALSKFFNNDMQTLFLVGRNRQDKIPKNLNIITIPDIGGWHLCSMFDIIYKMRNYSHANEIENAKDEKLIQWIKEGAIDQSLFVDIHNKDVDMYPQYIVDNKKKFDDLGWTISALPFKHYYQNIDGWFTFPKLYDMFVEKITDGGKMAEVGVWKGKSICYLGVAIKNSGKNIKVYAVDTWSKISTQTYQKEEDFIEDKLYKDFIKSIEPISDLIIPKRGLSMDVYQEFPDGYFDIVFIDADHNYQAVKQDIQSWLPKVKPGGIIAGHDYPWDSVKKAVHEIFEKTHQINQQEQCWWVEISE